MHFQKKQKKNDAFHPTSKPPYGSFIKMRSLIFFPILALLSLLLPQLSAASVCDQITYEVPKKECQEFIRQNPGSYKVKTVGKGEVINATKDDNFTIYILNDESYSFAEPFSIKDASNIGIFGERGEDGFSPIIYTHQTAQKNAAMFSFDNCRKCKIAYLEFEPSIKTKDSDGSDTHIYNKVINITGSDSSVTLSHLYLYKLNAIGYIKASDASSIRLKEVDVKNKNDPVDEFIKKPAIELDNCKSIHFDKVEVSNFDPALLTQGIVRISDPTNLIIANSKIILHRHANAKTKAIGLEVHFSKVNKPLTSPILAEFTKLEISKDGDAAWPGTWRAIELTARHDATTAPSGSYDYITGKIVIRDSQVPGETIYGKELFPRLKVQFGTLTSTILATPPVTALITSSAYASSYIFSEGISSRVTASTTTPHTPSATLSVQGNTTANNQTRAYKGHSVEGGGLSTALKSIIGVGISVVVTAGIVVTAWAIHRHCKSSTSTDASNVEGGSLFPLL